MATVQCPLLSLKETSIDTRDMKNIERLTAILQNESQSVVDAASFRGDSVRNFFLAMRDVDRVTRENYKKFGAEIGRNLTPLIVLNDSDPGEEGIGTTITYYAKNGEIRRYSPTPQTYELYKDLSHLVMGVFVNIAPYLKVSGSVGYVDELKKFQRKVQAALEAIPSSGLTDDLHEAAEKMLTMTDNFIDDLVRKKRTVTISEFRKYVNDMVPYCEQSMHKSVNCQTRALVQQLQELKQEMGDQWEEAYFAIPTVWSVDGINVRTQVLETLCTERQFATHVLKMQNIGTIEEARNLAGVIVGDRAIASCAFEYEGALQHFFALSTPQDLLSEFADLEIKAILADEKK